MHTCIFLRRGLVSVLEEFDCRVATDAILLSQVRLFCGVHFCQSDLRTFRLQFRSSFGILRGQGFAVATPWGI